MLIQTNAQNAYLIYSVCRLLLKINCSNVFNTLFINKAAVNLATRDLVTCNSRETRRVYILTVGTCYMYQF